MTRNYTKQNQESTSSYTSYDDTEDIVDFLKNPESFRTFDKGLIELLKRNGYPGDTDNLVEMSKYLFSKLRDIHSTITKKTVDSWFSGERRPKIEAGSRQKIYEICFALNLTYKETRWFFHHVYYDRAFNCHTIEEAVFFYAFLNGISYAQAQNIIREIHSAAVKTEASSDAETNYTQYIKDRISDFQSEDELKEFLISNKENFASWNRSALKNLNDLMRELIATEEAKKEIDNLKRKLRNKLKSHNASKDLNSIHIDQCGLLMKEILYDAQHQNYSASAAEYILETIDNKNIRNNTFLLDRLLCTVSGIPKNTEISYIVQNNFPSKKVMSDVLSKSKISVSKSYDSIRKMIVLLDFYRFWVQIKIGITDISDNKDNLYAIYLDEANDLLYQCGYEELYAGNPYDWLFLCSAQNAEPLAFFRACMLNLLPDE